MVFRDRADAGRKLASALTSYKDKAPVILALPRGGVPVAAEIAAAFAAPLDLILVRKIGTPDQPELAMGAVVDGAEPIVIRNEHVIRLAGVSEQRFKSACARELAELESRRQRFATWGRRAEIADRVAIVVDDGIATGATARAALQATRSRGPRELVLAVPVAAPEVIAALRSAVDTLICLETPERFDSVGSFYRDFRQVEDDEVNAILSRLSLVPPRPTH